MAMASCSGDGNACAVGCVLPGAQPVRLAAPSSDGRRQLSCSETSANRHERTLARRGAVTLRSGSPKNGCEVSDRGRIPVSIVAGTFAIAAGTVAADHLDFGMLPPPSGEAVAVAAVEHVHWSVAGHVNHHSAVMTSSAERGIVETEHRHRRLRRVGQVFDQPQQRVATRGRPDDRRQPGTGPARQRQADLREHAAQPRRQPRMRCGQPVDLLGERPHRAAGVVTAKPPELHLKQIVVPVSACRRRSTIASLGAVASPASTDAAR